MLESASKALAIFLDQNAPLVDCSSATLFLRARAGSDLPSRFDPEGLTCVQSYKPHHDQLRAAGYRVTPLPPQGDKFDLCLFLPTAQREENLYGFALAAGLLSEGGALVSSMPNKLGAGRFEELQARLFGNVETYSKNKCRVFLSRSGDGLDRSLAAEWLRQGDLAPSSEIPFFTRPGIFGWNKIDKGSALLCDRLPAGLSGRGADLGCGYGYIAKRVADEHPAVTRLDLFEAEMLALEAAKRNLNGARPEVTFNWQDVSGGLKDGEYDFVLSNPPFHSAGGASVSLGQSFVREAAAALKKGGSLYIVANRLLPYEDILKRELGSFEKLADEQGFKVLTARR